MKFDKSRSGIENELVTPSTRGRSYMKSKTVQLKEINDQKPIRSHGKTYTMGPINLPSIGLNHAIDKPLKPIRETDRLSTEYIKQQNIMRPHNDTRNRKNNLDAQISVNKGGKVQMHNVPTPATQNMKRFIMGEQQNNAENSNTYREAQKWKKYNMEREVKGTFEWNSWKEDVENEVKEMNEKENNVSDDNEENQEDGNSKEDEESEEESEEEEEEKSDDEEEEEEDDEEEEEQEQIDYGRLHNIQRKYKENRTPETYSKGKNMIFTTSKKTHQEINAGNKLKGDTENNRENQTKRESNETIQKKQRKFVSIQKDLVSWEFSSTSKYSPVSSYVLYKKTKFNGKTIKQIIHSKLRKAKIILKFLYICRKNIYGKLNTGPSPNSANKMKNVTNKIIRLQGPFLLKRESEKQTTGKIPRHVPMQYKTIWNNTSAKNKSLQKNKKLVLKKEINAKVYQLFRNMLAIDTLGRLQRWNGYKWNIISIHYYRFTSIYTNNKGHLLCVDQNYNPGYIMENKYFQKIESWQGSYLSQIITDQNNKIWGLNLSGDVIKWNKYYWMKIKKAYGISKIKFITMDRKNHLWVLDINNFFFSYDTINKSWKHKNINGTNIKCFDFDENNYIVAITTDGLIKIRKRKKWIHYGTLGQLKICGVHFIRETYSANSIVKTKNEKKKLTQR